MISGEKIGQYIAHPNAISHEDLESLNELAKKYPYCSSVQLLLLKGLAIHNDLNFESQLKITAINSPDRAHLYALIHSGETTENEALVAADTELSDNSVGESSTSAVKNDIKTEVSTTANIADNSAPDIKVTEPEIESGTTEETPIAELNELPNQIEQVEETINETLSDSTEKDSLEIGIINQAIDVALSSTELERDAQKANEKEIDNTVTDDYTGEISSEITKEENLPAQELSFIEWLKLKQKGISVEPVVQGEPESDEKENLVEVDLKSSSKPGVESTNIPQEESKIPLEKEKKSTTDETNSKKHIDALLDKFMQEEPRISKPVKDFYNPVKSAQKSVEESDDLVTETLANIHYMQKNYTKAISTYEKLILLYPEKKAFFASRIEKIREESKKR